MTIKVDQFGLFLQPEKFVFMNQKPTILVTNDDGITAKGIRTLIEVMATIGNVIVVAPDKPQSAMGHAITINNMLYLFKCRHFLHTPCRSYLQIFI